MEKAWFDRALGLNTLTSKNDLSNWPPQNPRAEMSRRAPMSVMADLSDITSPERGCKWGSIHPSWHTSFSIEAVRSLTSL